MSDQHDRFKLRHIWSQRAVHKVAAWYNDQGFDIYMGRMRQAPTAAQHADYSDKGDLHIRQGSRWLRVEVHRYNKLFTDLASCPWDNLYLITKARGDRVLHTIDRFIITNRVMTHAAIVYMSDEPYIFPGRTYAPNTHNNEEKYCCKKTAATFLEINVREGQNV